jgi:hypothetical protein
VHFHAKRGHGADVTGECEVDGWMTKTKKDWSKNQVLHIWQHCLITSISLLFLLLNVVRFL